MINLNNSDVGIIFGSLETCSFQSHPVALSPSARGIEYPFSSSSLHFLTRILLSQNSTKLNIKLNSQVLLQARQLN
jgi:hypothetical protein